MSAVMGDLSDIAGIFGLSGARSRCLFPRSLSDSQYVQYFTLDGGKINGRRLFSAGISYPNSSQITEHGKVNPDECKYTGIILNY